MTPPTSERGKNLFYYDLVNLQSRKVSSLIRQLLIIFILLLGAFLIKHNLSHPSPADSPKYTPLKR